MSTGKIIEPTLDEISRWFPEALELFDWACPSIAASGRAKFLVRAKAVNAIGNSRRPLTKLIAQAPTTFDDVPSPVQFPVKWYGSPRDWWYETAGGYTCTPTRALRAYWDATARVWCRVTWTQPRVRVVPGVPGRTAVIVRYPKSISYTDGI